jgi:hypothetical protein
MPDTKDTPAAGAYAAFVGRTAPPRKSGPLGADELRRFVQAIMDDDPAYYDPKAATASKAGEIVAPPLYPVHAFRRPLGTPDPLQAVADDPQHDGIGAESGTHGLPPIPSPFKRRLNGGNEVEFFRCLRPGECAVAKPRYKSVQVKQTRSGGEMMIVVIETRWETESGELLMINRQTSLRR